MKNLIKKIAKGFIGFLFIYFLIVFYTMSFDISEWSAFSRFICSIVGGGVLIAIVMLQDE